MNWSALISSIQAAGLSQPQIAAECGCAQSTISDLAGGRTKDPRYSIGQALNALALRMGVEDESAEAYPAPALTGRAQADINTEARQQAQGVS